MPHVINTNNFVFNICEMPDTLISMLGSGNGVACASAIQSTIENTNDTTHNNVSTTSKTTTHFHKAKDDINLCESLIATTSHI